MVENITKGYKKTEVGIIPQDWNVYEVQDAYNICNNLRLPISEQVRKEMKGQYPYYGPTKIQDYINQYRLDGEYALIGEDGDHFLKWSTMPMTLLATGKFNVNNHAHVIQGTINETKWFYWYFYNKDITPVLSRQGAGRYKLNKATLKTIKMPIPPRTEQTAIATVLFDIDVLINSLGKLIDKKKKIKQCAMQELLTGKKRLKGFNENWKEIRLGDVIEKIIDNRGKTPPLTSEGIELLETNSIHGNNKNPNYGVVSKFVSKEIYESWFRAYIKKNDILVSTVGMVGETAILLENRGIIAQNLIGIRISINSNPEYIYYCMNTEAYFAQVRAVLMGAVQPSLKVPHLMNFKFHIPIDTREQTAITQILSDMDTEIEKLNEKLNKYKAIKQGMMQELLTGKRRVI